MSGIETPLRQAFNVCLGAYNRVERQGEFEAWGSFLGRYPTDVVGAAVMQAPDKWPDRMPTVGQIRGLIESIIAKRRSQTRDQQQSLKPKTSPSTYTGHPKFNELAEKWESESIEAGLDPDRPPPHPITMRRMCELNEMWAAIPNKAIDGPINPNPRERKRIST